MDNVSSQGASAMNFSTEHMTVDKFRKLQDEFSLESRIATINIAEQTKKYQALKKEYSKDDGLAEIEKEEAELKKECDELRIEFENNKSKLANIRRKNAELSTASLTLDSKIKQEKKNYRQTMGLLIDDFLKKIDRINTACNESEERLKEHILENDKKLREMGREIAETKRILRQIDEELEEAYFSDLQLEID